MQEVSNINVIQFLKEAGHSYLSSDSDLASCNNVKLKV